MALFQNPTLPRVIGHLTESRMELMVTAMKEQRKRQRYLGSALQNFNDRMQIFGSRGGLKGTRFVVDRHHHRTQYFHPKRFHDKYSVRAVRVAGAQFDQMGNTTRVPWDQTLCSTNVFQDPTFQRNLRCMNREDAIAFLEEWGLRYVLLDEVRKPSLEDAKYHRHQIYANKFSWSPDPETNAYMGDADWKWKGMEQLSYKECGAHSKHPANQFARSLWQSSTVGKAAKAPTKKQSSVA